MAEPVEAKLTWIEGMRFVARADSGHGVLMDSKGRPEHLAATPMELLLISLAGCTAMDVVAILEKMRQPLSDLEVRVRGDRTDTQPKRYTSIEIHYIAHGKGLAREKVERAVSLSHSTYCSVGATLRPDCPITSTIEIVEE